MARSLDRLRSVLGAWKILVESVEPLPGGWNSATWLVRSPTGNRYGMPDR